MPPKAKLHNKNGKTKSFPRSVVSIPVQPSTSSETSDPEVLESERRFEVELCWCIQQLEITLEKKNLNPKQAEESVKVLNVLKNNTQLPVKKRHLMRLHFGDYRTKMATESKKAKKVNNQISFMDASTSDSKSTFLRKTASLTSGENSFRFNFGRPKDSNTENNETGETNVTKESESALKNENDHVKDQRSQSEDILLFNFSNTSPFKFNFNADDNI